MGAWVGFLDNWAAGDGSKYTGRRLRQLIGATLTRSSTRPLGSRQGAFAGTVETTVSATGFTWLISPHRGVLDLETSSSAGAYTYSLDDADGAFTGTIPPADSTRTRIDLIGIKVADPTEGDGSSTPAVTVVYTPGTFPTSVPATPAGTMTLAQVTVPPSGGADPSVTWVARFTCASGGILPVHGVAHYPSSPYKGQHIYDLDGVGDLVWDGSAWTPGIGAPVNLPMAGAFASVDGGAGADGRASVTLINGQVMPSGVITGTFTGALQTLVPSGGVPVALRPARKMNQVAWFSSGPGRVIFNSDGSVTAVAPGSAAYVDISGGTWPLAM